jgi:hypothetical protein
VEVHSYNHFCRRKPKSVTYCECVSVVLVIQHAICMGRIILSSVICLTVLYFSTLSHKVHDFEEKVLNVKCVVWFPLQRLSKTFLILRRTERNKYPFLLSDFNKTWLFSRDFRKILRIKFMKSVHWEPSCSMRTDRQWRRSEKSLCVSLRTRLKMLL